MIRTLAFLTSLGLLLGTANHASGGGVASLVKSGPAFKFVGDHAWANAWNCYSDCYGGGGQWAPYDYVANWSTASSGPDVCEALGSCYACSTSYSDSYYRWRTYPCYSNEADHAFNLWTPYRQAMDDMAYLYTGVCHQAANRANNRQAALPWVKDTNIGGGSYSYSLFYNCGRRKNLFGTWVPKNCDGQSNPNH